VCPILLVVVMWLCYIYCATGWFSIKSDLHRIGHCLFSKYNFVPWWSKTNKESFYKKWLIHSEFLNFDTEFRAWKYFCDHELFRGLISSFRCTMVYASFVASRHIFFSNVLSYINDMCICKLIKNKILEYPCLPFQYWLKLAIFPLNFRD
jgi:hypothetical protein